MPAYTYMLVHVFKLRTRLLHRYMNEQKALTHREAVEKLKNYLLPQKLETTLYEDET
jgi:hypothetical protein